MQAGRLDEAEPRIRKALQLRPAYPEARNNLGALLLRRGRTEEAAACFRETLDRDPVSLDARRNLALADVLLGRHREAEEGALAVLRLDPDDPVSLSVLGQAVARLGRIEEGIAHLLRAVRLKPDMLLGYLGLAETLRDFGRLDEAAEAYRAALRLEPDNFALHNELALVLRRQRHYPEALACYDAALRARPDYAQAWAYRGGLMLDLGQIDEAERNLRSALALSPNDMWVRSSLLFCLTHSARHSAAEVFDEHRRWGEAHAARAPAAAHPNDPDPHRRLRVGYVSPDFRNHVLAKFFAPLLRHHDPARVEVTCYAQVERPDEMTERLREMSHRWRPVAGLSDAELAARVRDDGIDILVDLAGHTAGNRLTAFGLRPAPVQATYLGYFNTTGSPAIDYLITNDVLHPPGVPSYATEELFRLPRDYCCFTTEAGAPEVGLLPAATAGRVTFGSLHNLAKLNDRTFDLWAELLRAVPSARLLVFRDALYGEAREWLRQAMLGRGVADDRLDLRKGHAGAGYLEVYNEIDVCLDTFPYSGHTTTCEALWMGVPVLTLTGETMVSRSSAMQLSRVGLRDFIAGTPADYVEKGRRLSSSPGDLAAVRAGLRARMAATIGDGAAAARGLEEAYREMWRRWCAG